MNNMNKNELSVNGIPSDKDLLFTTVASRSAFVYVALL